MRKYQFKNKQTNKHKIKNRHMGRLKIKNKQKGMHKIKNNHMGNAPNQE